MSAFEPYLPTIQTPYPSDWSKVSDFKYTADLYLARAREKILCGSGREAEYVVAADFTCQCLVDGEPWEIRVPKGMLTDLASVPPLWRIVVGRVGTHLEAAIVHDFLFVAWQDTLENGAKPHQRDFDFANEIMRHAMLASDVPPVPSWMIQTAVTSWVGRRRFFMKKPGARYVRVPGPEFLAA